MRTSSPSNIAITGASSGLGAALAREFAESDRRIFLCARRVDLLDQVAEACRTRNTHVETAAVDVRAQNDIVDWVIQIDERHPIDMLIVNAGVFGGHGPDGEMEKINEIVDTLDTNLKGSISVTAAMADRMRKRKSGHIVLVSSLASFYPQADAPTYSASKAGLTAYGEALREFLAPDGVRISIVHPGNIESAQTAVHRGWMPMMLSAENAAARIGRAIEQGKSNINFPFLLYVLIWMNRFLPWQLRALTNRAFRFHVEKTSVRKPLNSNGATADK